jgi:hypothetical protein
VSTNGARDILKQCHFARFSTIEAAKGREFVSGETLLARPYDAGGAVRLMERRERI